MKTKYWIWAISALTVLCLGLSIVLLLPSRDAGAAEIWSEGKRIATVSLAQDQTITVETETGVNVVTVKDGAVGVIEANCPDKHCVNRGMCRGGAPVVCLPNRLVIKFTGKQPLDGIVG